MKTIKVKDLMSIAGKGGLYRFLAQARNGVVVESLNDKRRSVVPPTARISSLEDISIYAENEDVPLSDVLMNIYEKEEGKPSINPKVANEELKSYFRGILPEYDEERVYVSDIKKVLNWYNILHTEEALEIVDKEEEQEKGADSGKEVDSEKTGKEEKSESEKGKTE